MGFYYTYVIQSVVIAVVDTSVITKSFNFVFSFDLQTRIGLVQHYYEYDRNDTAGLRRLCLRKV